MSAFPRVALLAGGLGQGGAEKQLVYAARALRDAGAQVRVYSLTAGDVYEAVLRDRGLPPVWIGTKTSPLARLQALISSLRRFRPHVVQAGHFFVNLYAVMSARSARATALGTIRNDGHHELATHGIWGRPLLRLPPDLLVNSCEAKRVAEESGRAPNRVHLLANVIDLDEFDRQAADGRAVVEEIGPGGPIAAAVGRLVPAKRFDQFVAALARARQDVPELRGLVVGDGPERAALERQAADAGLVPPAIRFLGARADVPAILTYCTCLVLPSEHEGFPNVLLEAMAARLPAVTTAAGDAGLVVTEGETGFVVPFADAPAMAARMVLLARAPVLRGTLAARARRRAEREYAFGGLADRLLAIYAAAAAAQRREWIARAPVNQAARPPAMPGAAQSRR